MLTIPDSIKNIWFTSDCHFGHINILKYDNRPFKDIYEHDNHIINRWNKVIKETDYVFHLGDFSLSSNGYVENILQRLNGIKFFISGSHDKNPNIKLFKQYGTYLGEQITIEIEKQFVILNHYSMQSWDKRHLGSWHLFGHDHSGKTIPIGKSLNVAIHLNNYYPINYTEIKEKLSK